MNKTTASTETYVKKHDTMYHTYLASHRSGLGLPTSNSARSSTSMTPAWGSRWSFPMWPTRPPTASTAFTFRRYRVAWQLGERETETENRQVRGRFGRLG